MRDEIELTLPDVCVIQRATNFSDGQGGQTEAWATASTTSCRVSPAGRSAVEVARADRTAAVGDWIVTLPYLSDVTVEDRLLVNGTTTYEVTGLRAPRSWELSRRVECKVIS